MIGSMGRLQRIDKKGTLTIISRANSGWPSDLTYLALVSEIVTFYTLHPSSNAASQEHVGKLYTPVKPPTPERRKRSNAFSDSMRLDDTRDKVYIHDLDEEVSDIESEEEKLLFLPDIEKRLTKIPKSVLISQSQPPISNEVVLYSVPESLSIPREEDSVRKAIIETRARAREKQAPEAEAPRSQQQSTVPDTVYEDDEDAMDLG